MFPEKWWQAVIINVFSSNTVQSWRNIRKLKDVAADALNQRRVIVRCVPAASTASKMCCRTSHMIGFTELGYFTELVKLIFLKLILFFLYRMFHLAPNQGQGWQQIP